MATDHEADGQRGHAVQLATHPPWATRRDQMVRAGLRSRAWFDDETGFAAVAVDLEADDYAVGVEVEVDVLVGAQVGADDGRTGRRLPIQHPCGMSEAPHGQRG